MGISKKRNVVILAIAIVFISVCLIFIDNKNIDYENFSVKYTNKSNTDVNIVHLSDLHFPKIKADLDKMIERIDEEKPDIIAITGDLIDGSAIIEDCGVFEFIEKIKGIAPVYYVNGNHEAAHPGAQLLYSNLTANEVIINEVIIMDNESVDITIKGQNITIIGLTDNTDYSAECYGNNENIENNYIILLAHRPDYQKWLTYTSNLNAIAPNLILSGHIHGGQIRLFGKGIMSPDFSLFPKFDAGMYLSENNRETVMIVSKGVGNSITPARFNNKPHVPIINISF